MKSTLSLEAYLKRLTENGRLRRYVQENGSPAYRYQDALTQADTKTVTPAAGIPRVSGYRDYLSGLAGEAKTEGQKSAYAAYLSELTAARGSVSDADARAAAEEKSAAQSRTVMSDLRRTGTLRYSDAYAYARRQGMTEEDARSTATLAVRMNERSFVESLLEKAVKNRDNRLTTLIYAKARGVSEEGLSDIQKFYDIYDDRAEDHEDIRRLYERLLKSQTSR